MKTVVGGRGNSPITLEGIAPLEVLKRFLTALEESRDQESREENLYVTHC